jgi:hypothetical protein
LSELVFAERKTVRAHASSRRLSRGKKANALECAAPVFESTLKVNFRQNLEPAKVDFAVRLKRFTVEQIVAVLKQVEAGVPPVHVFDES